MYAYVHRVVAPAVCALGLAMMSANSHALPCGNGYVDGTPDGVEDAPSYTCRDGTNGTNGNDSASEINTLWSDVSTSFELLAKWERDSDSVANGTEIDVDLTITNSGNRSGTWSFGFDIWDVWANLIIVLKDGKVFSLGGDCVRTTPWSSYQADEDDLSGDWDVGGLTCTDSKGKESQLTGDISHISFYGTPTGSRVPEPAALGLAALGFIGVGVSVVRRRRRSA